MIYLHHTTGNRNGSYVNIVHDIEYTDYNITLQ